MALLDRARDLLGSRAVLPLGLLACGSLTTLSMKAADREGFDHPFVQAWLMFLGEIMCLVPLMIGGGSSQEDEIEAPALLFLPPALLDVVGASLLYYGLTLTAASTYQMLRASVVPFTGILTFLILKRRPLRFQVAGMSLLLLGSIIVGFAAKVDADADANAKDPILGNCMVLLSQMASACQLVWEEKVFSEHRVSPLRAVGLEGAFGVATMSVLLLGLNFVPDDERPGGTFENIADAFNDITGDGLILLFSLLGLVAVTGVNYFGVRVTQAFSAQHRTIVDTTRTLVVWFFSLALGWERSVSILQVFGFFLLILGTLVFNAMIRIPALFDYPPSEVDHTTPLLS